ncbi:egl-4, partial [Symbiodinium natans]
MSPSYYAVGSWDDWTAFHLLCFDKASRNNFEIDVAPNAGGRRWTMPVRRAPGVEEFQIVEDKSWARRYFPVDGGRSIAGPEERHGANWRAQIPCHCRDLQVTWDPAGQRNVKWQFMDHAGRPVGRPVDSRNSSTATFFLIGSWNDWQDFVELRPRPRSRKEPSVLSLLRGMPRGEDERSDQIHCGRIPIHGAGTVELQVAQGRDWEQRFYPADTSSNAQILGPSRPPHGMNWRIHVPDRCRWLSITWTFGSKESRSALSWKFLDQEAREMDISQELDALPAKQFHPDVKEMPATALLWRICGGSETNGVIVRMGPAIHSPQAETRLSTGSIVWELELRGARLHFRKLRGEGPTEGWISTTVNRKVLADRCVLEEHPVPGITEMCQRSLSCNTRHIKSAFCDVNDMELFEALWSELDVSGKYRPPGGMAFVDNRYRTEIDLELVASAFILRTLIATLNVEMLMWWANVYEDGSSGCDFHRDCHLRHNVNVTVSASFGAARELVFRLEEGETEIPFLQANGDIMAFNDWVDDHFLHRVYPQREATGPRISIILMGRTSIFADQTDTLVIKQHHELLQQSCRRIVRDSLPAVLQREARLQEHKEHLEARLAERRAATSLNPLSAHTSICSRDTIRLEKELQHTSGKLQALRGL